MNLPRKVYAIQHNVTKRIYVGSSKDVDQRYMNHIWQLRAGKHSVEDMQKDFDEFGENYSLFILDEITVFAERKKEYEWMRKYNTNIRGIGYNYKDHEREIRCYRNSVPYMDGLPVQFEYANGETVKKEYIEKILGCIGQCDDIPLLDFILKMLQKSK